MSSASAYFAEQRRKQAEAGVHFLLVTLSLGKQRKVTRREAKKTIPYDKKSSAWACMPTLPPDDGDSAIVKKVVLFTDIKRRLAASQYANHV
jgi:hypothetical protein